MSGCVPVETVQRPSLNEVRSGKVRGSLAEDTRLQPGEISAEIDQIDPARRELRVVADDGRRDVLRYDINRTRVIYHIRIVPGFWVPALGGRRWLLSTLADATEQLFRNVEDQAKAAEADLRRRAFTVIRFTWDDVHSNPSRIAAELRARLG